MGQNQSSPPLSTRRVISESSGNDIIERFNTDMMHVKVAYQRFKLIPRIKFSHSRISKVEQSEGCLCAICLEKIKDWEIIRKLPCVHCYHEKCIMKWVKRNGLKTLCPLCRKPLFLASGH